MTTPPISPLSKDAHIDYTAPALADGPFNPNAPPWGALTAIAAWLASVVLILLMPGLFLFPYAQQRGIVGVESLIQFATTDKTAIFLQVLSIVPAHVITLAIAWAIVTRFGKQPFLPTLGWLWDERLNFWRSTLLALGLYVLGLLLITSLGGPETQIDKIIQSSRATAFLTALVATATAPLVEEVVYRGLLYSALHRVLGANLAVMVVFALFALVHVPQYWPNFGVILTICLLSLVLTLVRARTGKLLPCFIIHLIFNGVQAVFIVLEPYIKQHLPEPLQGGCALPFLAGFANLLG